MICIPVLVVLFLLGIFLKWLNDYGKPKNPKKEKQQTDLKNALSDLKNQCNIKK